MNTYNKIVAGALVIIMTSCAPGAQPQQSRSTTKDLAADKNANNVALIIGAPNDLGGVGRDVIEVSKLFKNPALGFKVVVKNFATSRDFVNSTVEVVKSLDENSTLFWYYSGHGLEDGGLFAQDQQVVYFSKILKAMKAARATPFKRLIVVMDSCFSGQNVDGESAIIPESVSTARLRSAIGSVHRDLASATAVDSDRPFEQGLVIAASRRDQTSQDAGSTIGGVFTSSWRSVLEEQFLDKSKTIRDMVEATVKETTANSGGGHTPVYKAAPESILDEPLIGPGSSVPGPSSFNSFIALAGDNSDSPFVLASVPNSFGIASARICVGSIADCRANAATSQPVDMNPVTMDKITDRVIVKSQVAIPLLTGREFSILYLDTAGNEKAVSRFKAGVAPGF